MVRAGDRFRVGIGHALALPTFDFETYSAAGYVWVPEENKWRGAPGSPGTKRGLPVVGVRNYVTHHSFAILSLAWNLLDGVGDQSWWPTDSTPPWPSTLIGHVGNGGHVEGFNINFEWTVWNFYCVPRWGWPVLPIEHCHCAMAKGRAWSLPGSLEDQGEVVDNLRISVAEYVRPLPVADDDDIPF